MNALTLGCLGDSWWKLLLTRQYQHCFFFEFGVRPADYSKFVFWRTCCRRTSSLKSSKNMPHYASLCLMNIIFFRKIASKSMLMAQFDKNVCDKNVAHSLRTSQPGSEILRSSKRELTVLRRKGEWLKALEPRPWPLTMTRLTALEPRPWPLTMHAGRTYPAQWWSSCRQLSSAAATARPARPKVPGFFAWKGIGEIRADFRTFERRLWRQSPWHWRVLLIVDERVSRAFCRCVTRTSGLLLRSAVTRCFSDFRRGCVFLYFWAFSGWKLSRKSKRKNDTISWNCLDCRLTKYESDCRALRGLISIWKWKKFRAPSTVRQLALYMRVREACVRLFSLLHHANFVSVSPHPGRFLHFFWLSLSLSGSLRACLSTCAQ